MSNITHLIDEYNTLLKQAKGIQRRLEICRNPEQKKALHFRVLAKTAEMEHVMLRIKQARAANRGQPVAPQVATDLLTRRQLFTDLFNSAKKWLRNRLISFKLITQ